MERILPAIAHLSLDGCVANLAADGESADLDILLYTGAPVDRGPTQMVFDLSGMEVPNKQVPLLFAHDPERPIGFAEPSGISTHGALRVRGTLLTNSDALKVVDDARAGFKWQASMGVRLLEARYVDKDECLSVNGHEFSDGYLITKSRLLEGSVLTLGADGNTSSSVLHMAASDGTIPVQAGNEESMSDETVTQDTRADLAAFLSAFPESRQGWAAQQFAAGRDLTECLTDEVKRLASDNATAEARLASVATAGFQGNAPAPAAEVESFAEVDLVAFGIGRGTAISDVAELLDGEFAKLSAADRREFSKKANTPNSNFNAREAYAACRKYEALGLVRVNWNEGKGF